MGTGLREHADQCVQAKEINLPSHKIADSVSLGPLTMKYVYDSYDGLLTTTSLPNTSTRSDQYTTNNESYSWTYTDTTINPLYRRSERLDQLGRVTSEQMGYPYSTWASSYQLNREPAYDSLGHVTQVNWSYQSCMAWPASSPDSVNADQGFRDLCSPTPNFSESYSYDAVGNRTDAGAGYNLGNRLTSVSWAMYVYDADGNVTSRTNTSSGQLMQFYWDAGSQLDSVLVSGGGSASYRVDYRYDAYGRLTWRSASAGPTGASTRLYVYNGSSINKEVDLVTGHTTEYEYAGIDHPTMSVTRDSTGTVLSSRVYMMDGLGNVVGSALDGSTAAAIVYDSWGNIVTDSTAVARLDTLRFGFKGMLYDETTGMYNARARWYQPDVGRFMSEDPLGLSAGINQYAFANDDPINGTDPSGMDCKNSTNTAIYSLPCVNVTAKPDDNPGNSGGGIVITVIGAGPLGGDVTVATNGDGGAGPGSPSTPTPSPKPTKAKPSVAHCAGQAAKSDGVAVGLDVIGAFIPEASLIKLGTGIIGSANDLYHGDLSGFAAGSVVTNLDAFDAAAKSGGYSVAKAIPGLGNAINAVSAAHDLYGAYQSYQSCRAVQQ